MERKGGCCLAPRHSAGGQAWQMGRIMLKFRPIVPKPAGMAPAPVMAVVAGKGKRRAVAGGSGRRGRKPKKAATFAALTAAPTTQKVDVVQVQEGKKDHPLSSPSSSSSGMTSVHSSPATLPLMPVLPAEEGARRQVVSWVTVEDVAGTWRDGEAPSATASGGDEAPAFVSDQWGRVTWTNVAFHRAVSGSGDGDAATAPSAAASEVRVLLAAKDGAAVPPWGTCSGFTCRVRVPYACPRRGSLIAPCDVWLLDAGGYLWRLDLQAALRLSLGGLL